VFALKFYLCRPPLTILDVG